MVNRTRFALDLLQLKRVFNLIGTRRNRPDPKCHVPEKIQTREYPNPIKPDPKADQVTEFTALKEFNPFSNAAFGPPWAFSSRRDP